MLFYAPDSFYLSSSHLGLVDLVGLSIAFLLREVRVLERWMLLTYMINSSKNRNLY